MRGSRCQGHGRDAVVIRYCLISKVVSWVAACKLKLARSNLGRFFFLAVPDFFAGLCFFLCQAVVDQTVAVGLICRIRNDFFVGLQDWRRWLWF